MKHFPLEMSDLAIFDSKIITDLIYETPSDHTKRPQLKWIVSSEKKSDEKHLNFINWWVGGMPLRRSILLNMWGDKWFEPFATADTVASLLSGGERKFLFRLSQTYPGVITFSCVRMIDGRETVINTRFNQIVESSIMTVGSASIDLMAPYPILGLISLINYNSNK